MKNIKRQELELLKKLCKQKNIPFELAHELIQISTKFSYENVSKGNRLNEYKKLFSHYSNK